MSDVVSDTLYWALLTPAQCAMQTRHILRTLQRYPDWHTQSVVLADFATTYADSFAYQSLGYEQALNEYGSSVAAYQQAALPLHLAVDSLRALGYPLLELAWITSDTDSLDDLTAEIALITNGMDSLHNLTSQLYISHQAYIDSMLQVLISTHSNLSCTSTFDCDEVFIYDMMLQRMQGSLPDSAELVQIRAIAMNCVPDGGKAVRGARALLIGLTGEYYTDADCTPLQRSQSNTANTIVSEHLAEIHPNPASGMAWIRLSDAWTDKVLDVRIMDMQGRLVWSRTGLPAREGLIEMSLTGWTVGTYLVHLNGATHFQTLKLMVQP